MKERVGLREKGKEGDLSSEALAGDEETGEDAALYPQHVAVTSLASAHCLQLRLGTIRHFQLPALKGLKGRIFWGEGGELERQST
uniref:Uncharacterized protein n=1 Tax=Knipowitschia caucasica TaxID=637954 RepID=A0AAV2MBS8_KNICA